MYIMCILDEMTHESGHNPIRKSRKYFRYILIAIAFVAIVGVAMAGWLRWSSSNKLSEEEARRLIEDLPAYTDGLSCHVYDRDFEGPLSSYECRKALIDAGILQRFELLGLALGEGVSSRGNHIEFRCGEARLLSVDRIATIDRVATIQYTNETTYEETYISAIISCGGDLRSSINSRTRTARRDDSGAWMLD